MGAGARRRWSDSRGRSENGRGLSMVRGSRRSRSRTCGSGSAPWVLDAWSVFREGLCSGCAVNGAIRIRRRSFRVRRHAFALLFVLATGGLLAENLLDFPLSVPNMRELAAGAPLLDMRLGYNSRAAYELLDVLGRAGRDSYLRLLWTIDLVLPAVFGLLLSLAILRGAFRAWRSIPLLAAGFDYAENITITILLVRYPLHEPVLVQF